MTLQSAADHTAVLAGGACTPFSRISDLTDLEFMAEAIRLATLDSHLDVKQIDGLVLCANVLPDDAPYLSHHLGITARWVMKADFGGASPLIGILRARAAIEAGLADVVVVVGGGNRADHPWKHHDVVSPQLDYANRSWVLPFGYGGPNSSFGLVQQRHMKLHGTTLHQLGKVATTFRANAAHNEQALLREPLTVEDYLGSPLISDPIRFYDCVMRCAGGVAVVVARQSVALASGRQPVFMGDGAEVHGYQAQENSPDRLATGFNLIGDRLFASTAREDLDFLQLYDDYPIAVLLTLEGLGLCEPGMSGKFIEELDFSIDGVLPINTGGGLLSTGQPRLGGGLIHVVEAMAQLRGEAGKRQVRDAEVGLVTGIGLIDYLTSVVVAAGLILHTRSPR